eukprot:COSAG02_NODE_5470_length_4297_cov_1.497141_5_plen_70_part_00
MIGQDVKYSHSRASWYLNSNPAISNKRCLARLNSAGASNPRASKAASRCGHTCDLEPQHSAEVEMGQQP